ncbi:MAG: UDP-glucose dehydrogenase family protein [Nanoarchaeota archaeon]
MKISVVGTSYVGLVIGACLAQQGNTVTCVDKNPAIINTLAQGGQTIHEEGLYSILEKNRDRISFTTGMEQGVKNSQVIFLAVDTPQADDGSADLRALQEAATQIASHMDGYRIIINKSTSPPGTAARIASWISAGYHDDFDVIANPEFLREGNAIHDFVHPDRILIGLDEASPRARSLHSTLTELYRPFSDNIVFTSRESAELAKYASNTMLALRIAFINEIARLAEATGSNIDEVRKAVSMDHRIGEHYLQCGPGFGGNCFSKDIMALSQIARDKGITPDVTMAAITANNRHREHILQKILDAYDNDITGKTFLIWGVAFKPGTDDTRGSAAIYIAEQLVLRGADVRAFDPVATLQNIPDQHITHLDTQYQTIAESDALIILTPWDQFTNPDINLLSQLRDKTIFDMHNLYNPAVMRDAGFRHISLGRPNRQPSQ